MTETRFRVIFALHSVWCRGARSPVGWGEATRTPTSCVLRWGSLSLTPTYGLSKSERLS